MNLDFVFPITKIVATLGPATSSPEIIRRLIDEGVRVARINFSHGDFDEYKDLISKVRKASSEAGIPVAVMGDLSGPKIRIGQVADGGVILEEGMLVEFQEEDILTTPGDKIIFSTNYPKFIEEVHPGQTILLNDGDVKMTCLEKNLTGKSRHIVCRIVDGGLMTSHKGVNLPDTELSLPALTEYDYKCIDFAVEQDVDYLALSFVRCADDVRLLKSRLRVLGVRPFEPSMHSSGTAPALDGNTGKFRMIPIISKIEKPQAIQDLENILTETDGIMVARGDLGVEMDLAEVAVLQKKIIHMCRERGVPVIVATQMLQSMIDSPTPTRAEVSDVANAIFDGADAVMLSGETSVGKWPVETVVMMNRIAIKTNDYLATLNISERIPVKPQQSRYRTSALAHGVKSVVNDIDAKLIVMWTQFGGSALYLSQLRLPVPVIACTQHIKVLNQQSLLYAMQPLLMAPPENGSQFIKNADRVILEKGWAKKGDAVIFVYGEPIQVSGLTNTIYIHYLGESTGTET
jgi:pyruvate kinase